MKNINKKSLIAFLFSFFSTSIVLANPVLGNVAAGNATIHNTPKTNTMTINQTSQKAIINWQSFNIGSNQTTRFLQPTGGITLNRISPAQGVSQIFGRLTATGQIILINPAGIYFGPNSVVNVGGLIATTSNISDSNFLKGNYIFDLPSSYPNASIINEGSIVARNHGLVALVGPSVTNNGLIQADLGQVILASGNAFTINFAGNDMINFAFTKTPNAKSGSVTNNGSLIANGGRILVTAQQASGVLDNVINLKGVVQARSVSKLKNGEIIISGDPNAGVVRIAAKIDASGKKKNLAGGKVKITGHNILLDNPTVVDVSGNSGGGSVKIGGDYRGKGKTPKANALVMMPDVIINANALKKGNGGNVILWSDSYTNVMGTILAQGGPGGGNGGLVETSSAGVLNANDVSVNTSAAKGVVGKWLLDPTNIYIATDQANATGAGMVGTDTSVNASGPSLFTATGAVQDSLLTIATLQTALNNNNVEVSTANASGTGLGNITLVNPLSWATSNSLTLTANNNIALNAGLTIGANSSARLILNATGSVTQSAVIDGLGGLTKQGAGTYNASQTNTYTGGTTITNGSIQVTNVGGIGPSGNISITPTAGNTAQLDLRTLGAMGAVMNNTTGTISLDSSAAGSTAQLITRQFNFPNPFVITGTNNRFNVEANTTNSNGGITGSGSFTKLGGGVFGFGAANNTYSGDTNHTQGQISAFTANALSPNSAFITSGGTTTEIFDHNNTVLSLAGTGGNISGFSGSILTIANNINGSSANFGGVLTGNMGVTLNLTGSGSPTQIFSGSNNYSNTTTITSGSLQANANNAFSANSAVNLANNANATLNLNNFNNTIARLSGGGASGGNVLLGNGTLTLNTNTNSSYGGSISGAGNVNFTGAATQTFSGNNTYLGTTGIQNGILNITNANGLGSGAITVNSGSLSLNLGGNTLANTSTLTLNGSGSGGLGALQKTGASSDSLSNNIVLGSATTISSNTSGGTLNLNGNISNGSNLLSLIGSGNMNISGNIGGGSGGLTKTGSGTVTLSGNNTYSGATTLNNGRLIAAISSALGSGVINIAPSASSTAILDLTGLNTLGNTNTINLDSSAASSVARMDTTNTITLSNAFGLTGSSNQFNVSANNTILNGNVSGTGGYTKLGNGTLILGGSNNYSGTTTINNGSLVANSGSALGSTAGGTVVNSGSTLTLSGANIGNENLTLNGVTLNSNGSSGVSGTITLGNATSNIINVGSGSLSLNGAINGNANLTLQGGGNLNLGADIGTGTTLSNLIFNTGLNLSNNVGLRATNIDINNGVNGSGLSLTATGNNINIDGSIALQNLALIGSGGNNTLNLDTGNLQTWSLNGADSGGIATSGLTGSGSYSNIQNINGSSGNDNIVLSGGSLSGSFNSGGGTNTLTGGSNPLVWNITGVDTVSVADISNPLTNIQHLVGGSGGNQFIFSDNARWAGTLNGGSLANTNTLDFQAYTTPVNISLTENKFNGDAFNNNLSLVSYKNINNLVANAALDNILTPTPSQLPKVHITGPKTGFIGDPLNWSGFSVTIPPSPPSPSPGVEPTVTGADVSPIIQQAEVTDTPVSDSWITVSNSVGQNINDLISQAKDMYDKDLNKVKINPYCNL